MENIARSIGRRIVVIGTTCAGKTTLARDLGERLRVPHVELDALHWGPNWTPAPTETFRAAVAEALSGEAWTTDGNYSKAQDIIWGRADTLIWLDYAFPVILWRLITRTLRRVVTREPLWHGNQETWRGAFFSRDSLFMWAITTHHKRRQRTLQRLQDLAYQHLTVVRLHSPKATRAWLEQISTRQSTI
ncbi:MAG TPA: adenylate kinase [Anaerolineae bacterium]|nr:adenylate kinase [Anaerolineae bacterium]HQI87292.1 adenylate kinase [Anaerolineae bacterium]